VLSYGDGAMSKDSLLASFARDINLLRSAGLLPIVVHGNKEMATPETRSASGIPQERPSSRTIEMILTGRVNTELVSLLNHVGEERASAIGLSGKDAGLFRAKRGGSAPTAINTDVLEMMLPKYVPVLSPVALGDDGESVLLEADAVAAEVAVALHADKLIYLGDVPGLLEQGELVPEITAGDLRARMDAGKVPENVRAKLAAGLRALEGGVRSVHVIDGRVPHSVIAELFTDTGVGTLLKRD
jgi:acetylglutamate kinase